MGKKDAADALERWRNPRIKASEEPISLVIEVLESAGFEVRAGRRGHYVAKHPKLDGPRFPTRALTISAHAHGKSGIVPKSAINMILAAIDTVEEQNEEQQD